MSDINPNKAYIFSLIENKGNIKIDQISSYDRSKLESAKYFLDEFKYSFAEFYELYKHRLTRVPIHRYNEQQVSQVRRNINCYIEEVFGCLPNGWILTDRNVYFYFGNEHDFHASYLYMSGAEWFKVRKFFSSKCSFKSPKGLFIGIQCAEMEQYKLFFQELYDAKSEWESLVSLVSDKVDELVALHTYEDKQRELVAAEAARLFLSKHRSARSSKWSSADLKYLALSVTNNDTREYGGFWISKIRDNDLKYTALAITNGDTREFGGFWVQKIRDNDLKYLALAVTNGDTREFGGFWVQKMRDDDLKYLALAITNFDTSEFGGFWVRKIKNDNLKYVALAITNRDTSEFGGRWISQIK
jgi:uncharacterized protein YebE (UPF0316 family)